MAPGRAAGRESRKEATEGMEGTAQWDAAGYARCESNGLPGCGLPNWVAEQPVKHKEQRWCTSKTTFSVIFKVQFHLSGPVLHTGEELVVSYRRSG